MSDPFAPARRMLMPLALALGLGLAPALARDIADMAGRSVTLAEDVRRIATLGSVPVLNGLVFAAGGAERLVSGLPERFRRAGRWRYQLEFAPQILDAPDIQDANYAPDLELVVTLAPDVLFTFDLAAAELLAANGVPAVVLGMRTPDEVKDAVALVAEVLGRPAVGAAYAAWFDGMVARIDARLADIALAARPSVLYISPKSMTRPHLIAEWWIAAGGGRSVTAGMGEIEQLALTTEVVIDADPDFVVVPDPGDVPLLRDDPVLGRLAAVQAGRVLITPMGAHIWGNRTVEQPLTALWLANALWPERFPRAELVAAVHDFYARFFGRALDDAQIGEILSGTVRVTN